MAAGNDFMEILPFETTRHILSFLDSRSLFACSCLSRTWYDTLNSLCPEIWFEACLRAGIYVRKDKFNDVREWKSFLHKMVARKIDLLNGQGFDFFKKYGKDPITTIYIHSNKIAIAYSDRIDLLTYPDHDFYLTVECKFEPCFLKFDDSFIIAASKDGRMSSWSLTNEEFSGEYTSDASSVTSFDFLTDSDTIACSFFSECIQVWSIFKVGVTARICTHQPSPIVKVMLIPDPTHSRTEERKRSILISLALQNAVLSNLELKYCDFTSRYSFSYETTNLVRLLILEPALDIFPAVAFSKNRGGLLFDGEFLYVIPPVPTKNYSALLKWKLRTQECWGIIINAQIVSLLGVGEKYIAYRKRLDNGDEYVVATDKFGKEAIATIKASRRTKLLNDERDFYYMEDDCMCLGDTAWLDGLNGENDCGNVYVSVLEDKVSLFKAKFTERNE